jgi:hypothetical protein
MSTVDLLRAHAPVAPDALRERVLTARPARPSRRRLRPVLVLAAAAVLAVAAAVVHGFTTSSPRERSVSEGAATTTPSLSIAAAPTADSAKRAAAVPSAAAGRLQHTDASLTVRVDDLGAMTTRATQIATSLGGYAQSVRYRRNGASYLELRLPAQNIERALARLAT